MEYAQGFSDRETQRAFKLARFDAKEIVIVRDSTECRRAAIGVRIRNGRIDSTAVKVDSIAVVRLGKSGYVVYVPGSSFRAGEFDCGVIQLDRRARYVSHLCR